MKTHIKKQGDTMVVSMDGKLDFELQEPLKQHLKKISADVARTDVVAKKVIFNLEGLEFVGSSGISSFVQTLKEFNQRAQVKPVYCNVKSEFRRVMKAFDEDGTFDFYETEERAKKSFDQ